MRIGNRLKMLRQEKGLSQENLAFELGISQSNYCKLEADSHFPNQDTLDKLAAFYKITPQELIAGLGNTQIQYNQNHDPQKLAEDLLHSKDKIIELQAKQIAKLESELKDKKQV